MYKQVLTYFFRVRLWSQEETLEQRFATNDKIDEDLRAELPLKHIWTISAKESD